MDQLHSNTDATGTHLTLDERGVIQALTRQGKEAVVFTLVEPITDYYIAIKIPGHNSAGIIQAMVQLHEQYGERFAQVFKTITADTNQNLKTSPTLKP